MILFGAADEGIARAFELSLTQLAIAGVGIMVTSRLLPGRPTGERSGAARPAAAQA